VIQLHKDGTFNVNWRKQILVFQLLAMLFTKKKRPKQGLKSIYHAQTIISVLLESVERNLDYLLAVNTLTGYLLLLADKPKEACEFLGLAEKVAHQMKETNI